MKNVLIGIHSHNICMKKIIVIAIPFASKSEDDRELFFVAAYSTMTAVEESLLLKPIFRKKVTGKVAYSLQNARTHLNCRRYLPGVLG